jgi:hypothetical protein
MTLCERISEEEMDKFYNTRERYTCHGMYSVQLSACFNRVRQSLEDKQCKRLLRPDELLRWPWKLLWQIGTKLYEFGLEVSFTSC